MFQKMLHLNNISVLLYYLLLNLLYWQFSNLRLRLLTSLPLSSFVLRELPTKSLQRKCITSISKLFYILKIFYFYLNYPNKEKERNKSFFFFLFNDSSKMFSKLDKSCYFYPLQNIVQHET